MKTEVVPQQDAITVDFEGADVSINQRHSYDGQEESISLSGKANVAALITALQQALEAMECS